MTPRHLPERFLVAFSFAGEQRDLVRAVAELVERELGSDTVFLDEWFEYYIAGAANLKLQHIYGERCELVVVCVSKHYGGKPWTQAEHEAVRVRLMKARSLTEERERDRILPIRVGVGDGDVDGIMFNTIVPDIRKMTVAQAAELILKRLRHVIPDLQSASTDFLPEHIGRYSRAYDHRGKEWIPDARIREGEGAGRQTKQIQFQSVHAAFPAPAEPGAPKAKIINRLPMGGTIFISYRRDEDAGFAGRLFDRLQRTFRRKTLFMDVDSIAPGQDFVLILEARVAECEVLLALIGRGWLTATDAAGRRRLDNPDDFVRIEIATALTQAKRVIPVLIEDVPMPRSENLPEELKPLVRRQALRLSHDRFNADSQRLIRALKRVLAEAEAAR